jgi:superfamily I DNA/RNA helicase
MLNAVIAHAKNASPRISAQNAQAESGLASLPCETKRTVAEQVLTHRENNIALRSQAVLFRTSSHSTLLELELGRRNIPFVKYGGLKFLDAAHIKDVLSLLRWVENPRGRLAGFRAVRLLPGVGPATAARLLDAMQDSADPVAQCGRFPAGRSGGSGRDS